MPNWCSNNISVSHADTAMMEKFAKAFEAGELFQTLVPLSSGEWDYGTATEEWGTKWDINGGDFTLEDEKFSGTGWFDTAWGPPIAFYEKLKELGFEVDASYLETGMCFVGTWTNEDGDDCVEYDFDDEDWRDGIDNEDILDILEQEYEMWKEWQDDDEQAYEIEPKEDDGA